MFIRRLLTLEKSCIRRLAKEVSVQLSTSSVLKMSEQEYPEAKVLTDPFKIEGEVVKGFGRGSKELQIPTANFSDEVVSKLPSEMTTGIYYGWAKLDKEPEIRKAVVSIGWNPYYRNIKKSVETHIIHDYGENLFYGDWLKVLICGYLRPEKNYDSLESLILAIRADIREAESSLDLDVCKNFRKDSLFDCKTSSPL